jgi:hypothetical protein
MAQATYHATTSVPVCGLAINFLHHTALDDGLTTALIECFAI